MSVCTFFGHRDCPNDIKPKLKEALINLIEKHRVNMFYVGNHGAYDSAVLSVMQDLAKKYPHISYYVVLAYLPQRRDDIQRDFSDTIFPEGIETVPKRFAVSWRNKWMIERSNYTVAYVTHSWGGAAKFVDMAKKAGLHTINIV